MSTLTKSKLTKLVGGLGLAFALTLIPGCGDKEKKSDKTEKTDEDDDDDKKGKKGKKGKDGDDAKAAAPIVSGATFAYMPKGCDEGRMYVDLAGLNTSAESTMTELEEKLMGALGGSDGAKAEKVLKVLKDGGFEPKMLKEASVCLGGDGEPVFVVALDPKLENPLELLAKAIAATGEADPKVEKKGDVAFMKNAKGNGALANPAPGIVVIGKSEEAVMAVAKGGDGADAFAPAKGQVIWARIEPKADKPVVEIKVKDGGTAFDGEVRMTMKGGDAKAMAQNPKVFAGEFEKQRDAAAAKVATGPFAKLSAPLKAVEIKVDGDTLVATGKLEKAVLEELGKTLAAMKPDELMQAL